MGSDGALEDLVIEAGRLVARRPHDSSAADQGDPVDLDGRFVLASLWDAHVHFDQWATAELQLDLSGTRSAGEAVARVAERVAEHPAGDDVLVGYGFRDGLWPDAPTLTALDAVSGVTPVALVSGDLHCVWLNSAAFGRLGVEPRPEGLLREKESEQAVGQLWTTTPEASDARAVTAASAAAARGVVGIVEFERARNLEVWTRRHHGGLTTLRVECAFYPPDLGWALGQGLRTGEPVPATDGLVRMGPLKVMTDGSLNTRTAYCHDPYPGLTGPHACGLLEVAPEQLETLMARARDRGITAAIHAIGDRANTLVLDVFERLGATGSIEHAQLLDDADLARFARLGVTASVQPAHVLDDRDVADHHWAGRTGRAFPFADLARAGATLALGSDAPVSPLDPWVTIAAAVHRSADDRPPWHPEQQLSIIQALTWSTRGGPAPVVGTPADLVVVDRDPLTSTPAELATMPVHATLVGGRWTWRAE